MGILIAIIFLLPPYWSSAYLNTVEAPTRSDLRERYRESEFEEKRSSGAINASESDLKEYLKLKTANNGLYNELYAVIHCESSWKPNAVGDNGLAFSLAQFHKRTFDYFCEKKGEQLDYYNPYDQIDLMIWAWENNLQNHWTCWRKLVVDK